MPTSYGVKPLLKGKKAWANPWSVPPESEAGGWDPRLWQIPALLRVFAHHSEGAFPRLSERQVVSALAVMFRDESFRRDHRPRSAPDGKASTQRLLDYMLSEDGRRLRSWWRTTQMRAMRQISNGREILEQELWGIHISLWELAHFRIPRELAFDSDVIYFMASCQGLKKKRFDILVGFDPDKQDLYRTEVRQVGFRKLCRSRWFRLALVAPYMAQFGLIFPGANFTESVARMEFLLVNPYCATEPELDLIMGTPMYAEARARMIRARRFKLHASGTYPIQPNGGWYMQGAYRSGTKSGLRHWQIWEGFESVRLPEPRRNPHTPRTFHVDES